MLALLVGLVVLAAGLAARRVRRRGRARRAVARRLRFVGRLYLGDPACARCRSSSSGSASRSSFRAGALNIGAEGQFYAGAIAATWVGLHLGGLPQAVAIRGAAGRCGARRARRGSRSGLAQAPVRRPRGDQHAAAQLRRRVAGQLHGAGAAAGTQHIYPQSDQIAESARLPLLPGSRLHAGLILAVVAAPWCSGSSSAGRCWGFRLRAVGTGPGAAEVSGRIDAERRHRVALLLSGCMAGFAGGVEVSGVSYALYQNLSPGYGFTAIAVALLARPPSARGRRQPASSSARSRRAPAPCSGMPEFRPWRYTWSRPW